jgi:hypothetical protein
MRDQYFGDVSDVIKFAFLRTLAGRDRTLGIACTTSLEMTDRRTDAIWSGGRKRRRDQTLLE